MKVLVLSDSHGNIFNMIQAVEREAPRMVFHLGDCWRDGEAGIWQLRLFPGLPGGGEAAVPGGQAGAAVPRAHLWREAVPAGGGPGVGGEGFGSLFVRAHPQAPGGHAGEDAVFKPRQHWGLRPAYLRRRDAGEREAGRPDGAAAGIERRLCRDI